MKHSARYSIDYVIKLLFVLLVPVVLLDIVISCYAIYSMRTQTVQSLKDTTDLYVSQIDTAHISINKYLIRCLTEKQDFQTALETEDELEYIAASDKVHKDVDTFMESFEEGYKIFIYNKENKRMFRPTDVFASMTKSELEKVNEALIRCMETDTGDSSYSDAWEILPIGSQVYFYKLFHLGNNFSGCFISAEDITNPLEKIALGGDGFIALTAQDGTSLTEKERLQEQGIHLEKESGDGFLGNPFQKNLIIRGNLTMGVFRPHIILNKYSVYDRIVVIQFIMIGAVMLLAVILFFSMSYMKRRVLRPIKQFSENLQHYDDTAELINLQDSNLIELEQANLQFKNLMRQIKKLKIHIYEKELEKQKTLMDYLQLQIRPHFFLNCLNTIYSMAQTQLYEEIMEMIMVTSDYFRYIFQNSRDFVAIKYELQHIENYMKIQKLRYGDGFSYEIYAEEGTEEVLILPIIIQTFIENSIKHAAVQDEPITIRTDVQWAFSGCSARGRVQIQITDTGKGFPEEVLRELNSRMPLTPVNGHRIGITNAMKRLELFYKEGEAMISFSNLPAGGACVTILLPTQVNALVSKEDVKS